MTDVQSLEQRLDAITVQDENHDGVSQHKSKVSDE